MTSDLSKGPSTLLFFVLTGVYVVAVGIGAWCLGYFDPEGTPLQPNEWGDVLAGVFSPLAFLWLIYASLSQRAELALQRDELSKNNETQGAQREEMQRQVEAMAAQARLLEAQAAATFDPIFVVRQLTLGNNNQRYAVLIENRGSEVVNIYLSGDFVVNAYDGSRTGFDRESGEVFYWGKEVSVTLHMMPVDTSALQQISIQFTRKDGAAKRNVYMLSIEKRSLRLVQSDPVMPSVGHDF